MCCNLYKYMPQSQYIYAVFIQKKIHIVFPSAGSGFSKKKIYIYIYFEKNYILSL